jgi:hypothetical protein
MVLLRCEESRRVSAVRQAYVPYAKPQPRGSDDLPAGCVAGAASNAARVPDMHATCVVLGAQPHGRGFERLRRSSRLWVG